VLELGKPGTAGVERPAMPVLRDGTLVGALQAGPWRERATARAGDREWVYTRTGRGLTARRAIEPEGAVRLSARPASVWKGTWTAELDGIAVEIRPASWWKGTRRYTVDGRVIGESGNASRWVPRPTLDLDDTLDLDAQVFLLWVELVLRRRDSAAAGAAAATAGGAASAGAAG
jgi:hypothetical protein